MGKSSPKIPVSLFKMSIQYGLCSGVVDWLHKLTVREKTVWSGRKCGPDALFIDQPTMFGGPLEEGGVQGFAYFQNGTHSQLLHPKIALKQGGLPTEVPGYRGIATLTFAEAGVDPAVEGSDTFTGGVDNPGFDGPGFYWVAGSPYLPGIWATVQRIPRPFLTEKAYIFREEGEGTREILSRYCFVLTWDQEIGFDNEWSGNDRWSTTGQDVDYDGDGEVNTRADLQYGLIAKFCDELRSRGEGQSEIVLHFGKGAGGVNEELIYDFGPGRDEVDSWNNGAFSDEDNYVSVSFLADDITLTSFGSVDIPAGTRSGAADPWDWQNTGSLGHSGLLDRVLADGDANGQFDYVFLVTDHHQDDRWDKFDVEPNFRYGVGDAGNAEMKADYHRIAEAFRGRCTKFRTLVWDEFHVVGSALNADTEGTTNWDILYMVSGAEFHASGDPHYGPYLDILASSFAWHWWQSRHHGFSAANERLTASYSTEFTNIYSSESTSDAYDAFIDGDPFTDPFDSDGGAEAWVHYFFETRIFSDYYDANPSHIIVECLTNPVWGMGYPLTALEMGSFSEVACTLYDEQFGLSMIWTKQMTIEDFVSEVLDHIDAALYLNPANGLFEINLIRNDYDPTTLRQLNPSNFKVKKAATRLVSEAINEITVSWTNPVNEQEETVTIQDQGGIVAAEGIIKSETRNYYGIRRVDLASEVNARDIRSASAPITTLDGEADRSFWDILPGAVLELVYPELQILDSDPMIVRVTAVDYGKPGASTILLTLSEDVFSLAPHIFETPPGTDLVDESQLPTEADFQRAITLPYFFVANAINAAAAAQAVYPDVFAGILAAEADIGSASFNLFGDVINPAGSSDQVRLGERDVLAHGTLQGALPWEAETTISDFGTLTNGTGPKVGGIMMIGDTGDDETVVEMAMFSASVAGVWTLKRGVLDTVPRAWPVGTEVWFMTVDDLFADQEVRTDAEDVDYIAQIIATGGVLSVSTITPIPTYTMLARPHLPLRPANVKINALAFQDVFYPVTPATVDITWSDRNRLTENAQILGWTDAGVTVEVGQTVEVDVYDEGDSLLHTFTGLTGGSASLDELEFSDTGIGYIRVFSIVGALRSLQYYEARVDTRGGVGYGMDYGNDYGGT